MYHDFVEQHFDVYNASVANRRHYRVDCPLCVSNIGKPDDAGHMHIFVDSWWCHCFRCGAHVPVTAVFVELGLVNFPQKRLDDVSDLVRKELKFEETTSLKDPEEIELPAGTYPITDSSSIVMRRPQWKISEWGISLQSAIKMRWMWNPGMDSFIFPVYMFGRLVYWSRRSMSGDRSSPQGEFAQFGILGNFDCELKDSVSDVYVVEGPKDAATLYQNGMWGLFLHGHSISPQQMMRLQSLPHEKRLVLDADVFHSSKEYESQGIKTLYLPSGDPADHGSSLKDVLSKSSGIAAKVRQIVKNPQVKS